MGRNTIIPENDGVRCPLNSGLDIATFVDMVIEEIEDVCFE